MTLRMQASRARAGTIFAVYWLSFGAFLLTNAAPLLRRQPPSSSSAPSSFIVHLKAPPVLAYEGGEPGFLATATPADVSSDVSGDVTVSTSESGGSPGSQSAAGTSGRLVPGQRLRRFADVTTAAAQRYANLLRQRHRKVASRVGIALGDIIYSLTYTSNAFAARLTARQVRLLQKLPDVAHIQRDEAVTTQEPYAPTFINVKGAVWPAVGGQSNAGQGIIIGVIDTGIWPEHPSFSDAAMPSIPIPSYWRGTCNTTSDFPSSSCNKKLIGARFFARGFLSRNSIDSSKEFMSPRDGNGHGTWCASSAAGAGGVSITSGGRDYGQASGIAPGSFLAVYKALWVSRGSDGGGNGMMSDVHAAIDQAVADGCDVISMSLGGPYVSYFDSLPLLYAARAGVFAALAAGNAGRPSSGNGFAFLTKLSNAAPFYLTVGASTTDRQLSSFGTVSFDAEAPAVASYSSHGPLVNPAARRPALPLTNAILKPDIMAPGSELWGAYRASRTGRKETQRFAVLSGTSMATPQLAGLAAIIMQKHPTWSPAQIRSAMMTTASVKTNRGKSIPEESGGSATPWGYGAGLVDGTQVLDPGLTFDAGYNDYVRFLAGIEKARATSVFGSVKAILPYNLNLPSIVVPLLRGTITVTRTVVNVASSPSTYEVKIVPPSGASSVVVQPRTISVSPGAKVTFSVTITASARTSKFTFGSLTWSDNKGHAVRCVLGVQGYTNFLF